MHRIDAKNMLDLLPKLIMSAMPTKMLPVSQCNHRHFLILSSRCQVQVCSGKKGQNLIMMLATIAIDITKFNV